MAEIRVELRDFTDGILGNLDITSSDDFPLSLSFQNFDVRDFNSRNGSFSKTFNIPASKNNNRLFNHIYKDGNIDVKKVRKDIKSSIYVDNIPVINGSLRVTKITKNESVLSYDCLFLGDNMDWANPIKEKELKDLVFSSSTYTTYPPSNPTTYTFENPNGYNPNGQLTNFPDGNRSHDDFASNQDKLVYPLLSVGEGDSPKSQVVEGDFVPCLYLKNIWDKIFESEGYTVESTFCDSDFFKSLIVPLIFEKNPEVISEKFGKISRNTDEDVTSEINLFNANDGTQTLNRAVGNPSVNISADPLDDVYYVFGGDSSVDAYNGGDTSGTTGNVQNGSSGLTSMIVKNTSGEMNLEWDIDVELFGNAFNVLSDPVLDFEVQGYMARVSDDDDSSVYDAANKIWESDVIDVNFTEQGMPDSIIRNFSGATEVTDVAGTKYVFYLRFKLIDYAGGQFGDDAGSVGIKYTEGSFIQIYETDEYEINEEIGNPAFLLPQGKQSEFISGVAQLFNLQFETDPIEKKVKVEPYNNFYKTTSESVNWTEKVDHSKNVEDEFLYDLKSKTTFKYKDASNDAFLDRYNKKNFVHWGAYEETDDTNSFLEGEYKIENKFFSATFNYNERAYIDTTAGHSTLFTPFIPIYHTEYSELSQNTDRSEKDFNIGARILLLPPRNQTAIDEGFLGGVHVMYSSESNLPTGYSLAPLPSNDTSATSIANTNFARANFINIDNIFYNYTDDEKQFAKLNNGYEDVDLNLSFSDVKYDVAGTIDASGEHKINGLYHYYYASMIKQLRAKPRIKKLYVNLTKTDIALLDFQKLIFIDGVYYRINKVIDYKPQENTSTKVELTEYFNLGVDAVKFGDDMDMVNGINL